MTRRVTFAGVLGLLLVPYARAQSGPPAPSQYLPPDVASLGVFQTGGAWCTEPGPYLGNPLGTSVRAWQSRQTTAARLDRFFIHPNEWYRGGATLGPAGRRHLVELADSLAAPGVRAFIDPSDNAVLDGKRRAFVITELANLGVADAERRVSLAYPKAEGLYGEEAPRAYWRLIQGGIGTSGTNGGTSGLGGGGFGGAGISGGMSGGFGGITGGFR